MDALCFVIIANSVVYRLYVRFFGDQPCNSSMTQSEPSVLVDRPPVASEGIQQEAECLAPQNLKRESSTDTDRCQKSIGIRR